MRDGIVVMAKNDKITVARVFKRKFLKFLLFVISEKIKGREINCIDLRK